MKIPYQLSKKFLFFIKKTTASINLLEHIRIDMKKIIMAAIVIAALAVPVLASQKIFNLLDQHTFTCPAGQKYCYLEFWRDGRLVGRKQVKANESIDVKFFGLPLETINATTHKNNTVKVNCTTLEGTCVPKASFMPCGIEYFKTEDCRKTEKCCAPLLV